MSSLLCVLVAPCILIYYILKYICPHCYYFPQAHEQLARVALETALSLPSNTKEAEQACSITRALAKEKERSVISIVLMLLYNARPRTLILLYL